MYTLSLQNDVSACLGWNTGTGKPMGTMGTGTVSDLLTHANTVPIAGYLWVSATCSHTQCGQCCLPQFNSEWLTLSPAPTVSYPVPSCPVPSPAPGCLEPHTLLPCAISPCTISDTVPVPMVPMGLPVPVFHPRHAETSFCRLNVYIYLL